MKHLVIKVVSFFAWVGILFSVIGGAVIGSEAGHGIIGAMLGFLVGCFGSGIWFLLVSMHDKLTVIADAASGQGSTSPKAPIAAPEEKTPGWLDVISGGKP
ncbi:MULTISPECIES: hypothetical protein [unclassified Pseudomonas]|uniref:hypothetical protein n=1 Tax=unclassified Pseudomonas TaxID=196821 RepID=UPI000D3BF641|nr:MULTISPECIES: hypothetical protein [unclassified Pseudomonas]RAU45201.1 hypothetical protein DBP26_014865 [Pseudomonas sp. RIT 409]RAU51349.1 hypothetical protein DBY65_019845 [Pseudomonas sp. RIT 412]